MTTEEFQAKVLERCRVAQVSLNGSETAQMEAYYRLLMRWNSKINLTALPLDDLSDRTLDRLLIEPALAASLVPEPAIIWFDVGSGGGSPAIPLKILRPKARLTMVESTAKKAAFLNEVVRVLELRDAFVSNSRFEDTAADQINRSTAELITVRAVRLDGMLMAAVDKLLTENGRVLSFQNATDTPEMAGLTVVKRLAERIPGSTIVALQRPHVPRGTSSKAYSR
jgi:16S rRNA (guanine527-N7)-methyltransferase